MTKLVDLTNRCVVVTGAGRGIGRAHALLLAKRGASVVVNDSGVDRDGVGGSAAVAAGVVEEIRAFGGHAVADSSDVSTPAGGQQTVAQALDSFGRLDAVINNAGVYHTAPVMKTTLEDYERLWRIHVGGHINVIHAAWPVMSAAGGGRIVMTGSGTGIFGVAEQSAYGSAKAAIYGLTRSLALEGEPEGIKVNMICPGGFTRMHETPTSDPAYQEMLKWTQRVMVPDLVAPAALWLASDRCTVSGQVFTAWAGLVVRVAIGTGNGYFSRDLSPEAIVAHYDEIVSLSDFKEPGSAVEEVRTWAARHPNI
jgi:NAD(P)-dependent dehydrogenase (short-subunit alcohol dehydrogenase family)